MEGDVIKRMTQAYSEKIITPRVVNRVDPTTFRLIVGKFVTMDLV